MYFSRCLNAYSMLKAHQVLPSSISKYQIVNRFIGKDAAHSGNLNALTGAFEKAKGTGLVGAAAAIGMAQLKLAMKNYDGALKDIAIALHAAKQNESLTTLALALRLRTHNDILDKLEEQLTATGGATEAEVSNVRASIRTDYAELKAKMCQCWMVRLAAAEFLLYEGKSDEALKEFKAIKEYIEEYVANSKKQSEKWEDTMPLDAASSLAFKLRRELHSGKATTGKVAGEPVQNILHDDSIAADITSVRKSLAMDSLTDDEVKELACILDAAATKHHFHEFFPLDTQYKAWQSTGALSAMQSVRSAIGVAVFPSIAQSFDKVAKIIPETPFYGSTATLKKLLASPASKNVLQEIRLTFGEGPKSPLSARDDDYFAATKALEEYPSSPFSASTRKFGSHQQAIARVLAEQLGYRVQVDIALALEDTNRPHEAIEVLNQVISADKFIYMWKALLARARVLKAVGLVEKSDNDFKKLFEMKKGHTLVDIPQRDEFRAKSSF